MKFLIKATDARKIKADLLAVFLWEDPKDQWIKETQEVDAALSGMLKDWVKTEDFEGKERDILHLNTHEKIPSRQVALVGLGKRERFSLYVLRKVMAKLTKLAKEKAVKRLALTVPGEWLKSFLLEEIGQAIVEGITLGTYKFSKYKSEKEKKEIEEVYLLANASRLSFLERGVSLGEIFSQAAVFCRDLVNEPASVTTPTYLSNIALRISQNSGIAKKCVKVRIYEKGELAKMGMGAFLAVAQGADEPPKFIRMEYKNGERKIVLVGKGITFDTGGLSLKSQEAMETMKMDMAGAAAVLAVFSVIEKIKPKVCLLGLIPAAENMPGSKAIKPGDIVKALNGKTIEVVNTDAEGRMLLADALSYAVLEKPHLIVDLATLTGACVVALGEEVAGIFGNDPIYVAKIKKAAQEAGEKLWEMPLEEDYKELLKSEVADLKNATGKKYGGAITAALFLKEFVSRVPWLHLDIAGPAWEEKGTALTPKGGSGFGVRTILKFLMNL